VSSDHSSLLLGGVYTNGLFVCERRFLAYVDLLGTTYTAPAIATGMGAHFAVPLMRTFIERHPEGFDEAAARGLLEKCLEVLFYRDARTINKVRLLSVFPVFRLKLI
jgi:20S proteasome subunit beta 7